MIENYNPIVKKNNVLAPFWDNAFIHKNASTGAVASFQDGVEDVPIREMSAEINPAQDLHGYDYPWAEGGGVNLFDPDNLEVYNISTDGNRNGHEFSTAGTYAIKAYGTGSGAYLYARVKNSDSTWGDINYIVGNNSVSAGAIITITDGQKLYVFDALGNETAETSSALFNAYKIQVALASSQPPIYYSYSNVCPISGYTGAEVSVTGINIWNEVWELGGINNQNGTEYAAQDRIRSKFIPCKPNSQYYFKSPSAFGAIAFYDIDKQCLSALANINSNIVRTSPNNACYIRFQLSASYGATYNHDVSINYPSTDTEYHAYTGNIYSITFPSSAGTVYGGTLSVNADGTGTLVVDKQYLDLSSISNGWASYPGIKGYTLLIPTMASRQKAIASSHFKTIASVDANATAIATNLTHYVYFCGVTKYGDTIANFKQWISDNNVEFVIDLDSPITYTIPANQIECITFLSGLNNVWINTGDITNLVYYSDAQTLNEETEMLKKYVSANTITDTASGAIATFPDGADDIPIKSLSVAIEPVQDLHGQDAPYPAGGEKNKFNNTGTTTTSNGVTFTVNTDGTVTCSGTATGTAVYRVYLTYSDLPSGSSLILNGCPAGGDYDSKYSMILTASNGSGLGSIDSGSGATYTEEQLANLAQFQIIIRSGINSNGLVFKPMIRLATETDDTFAPYSNICPISGHTSANVMRTGKNLLDPSASHLYVFTVSTYTYVATQNYATVGSIPVKGSTKYTLSIKTAPSDRDGKVYGFNKSGERTILSNTFFKSATFTTPSDCVGISFYSKVEQAVTTVIDAQPQLELGSSATDYEEYQGTTYPITFPSGTGTVYGGNITANQDGTGTLVITHDIITITDDDISSAGTDGNNVRVGVTYGLIRGRASYQAGLCDKFVVCTSWADVSNNPLGIGLNNPSADQFIINKATGTTVEDIQNVFGDGVQLYYPLATPLAPIPLSASQITTLLGTNSLFADCNGDVSVTYRADTALYIQKKIAEALNA